LSGSLVISQIPEDSPKVSPKDSVEVSLVTSPRFSFLFPKKESSKIPQIILPEDPFEEEYFKTFINPLTLENSKLFLEHPMAGQQKQQQPPRPPRIFNKDASRYATLNLPRNLNNFPDNYLKLLPEFNGEAEITALENLSIFDNFTDNLGLEHEDVYMRIFVQNFQGEARTWFKGLPPNSIDSWDALESIFLRQWGDKNDHLYYLTEF
jgi:hypothetical protein